MNDIEVDDGNLYGEEIADIYLENNYRYIILKDVMIDTDKLHTSKQKYIIVEYNNYGFSSYFSFRNKHELETIIFNLLPRTETLKIIVYNKKFTHMFDFIPLHKKYEDDYKIILKND